MPVIAAAGTAPVAPSLAHEPEVGCLAKFVDGAVGRTPPPRKRDAQALSPNVEGGRRRNTAKRPKNTPAQLGDGSGDIELEEDLRAPRWLWEALHPYQQDGVSWLWKKHKQGTGAVLADEMGLGKTVQVAAYLGILHHSGILQDMRIKKATESAKSAKPGGVLIVCPATLVGQWKTELNAWYPKLRVSVLTDADEQERTASIWAACAEQSILIMSYETMRVSAKELLDAWWVLAVMDEGQRLRNPNAEVTITAKRLSTPHRILLTGSPIQNTLQELWSVVDFACPGRLGTLPAFMSTLGHPIEAGSSRDANAAQATTAHQCAVALRSLTLPCILRRLKSEVMETLRLPRKQERVLFCNTTAEQYVAYVEALHMREARSTAGRPSRNGDIDVAEDAKHLTMKVLSVLRRVCNHPDLLTPQLASRPDWGDFGRAGKTKVLADLLKSWSREKHRCLIFVQAGIVIDLIGRWLERQGLNFTHIDGKTPVGERLTMVKTFNRDTRIFAMLLTNRVGGVGLNITGADRVVIFDPDWNPMTSVRARERVWRIGQEKEVEVYRFVMSGTLEEKIYNRQVNKTFLSQKVFDDASQKLLRQQDLSNLFEMPDMPNNMDPKKLAKLREKYKAMYAELEAHVHSEHREHDEDGSFLSDMRGMTSMAGQTEQSSALLQSLFDSKGIKSTFDFSKVEARQRDGHVVQTGAAKLTAQALEALKQSIRERGGHDISTPTWTGKRGTAGASVAWLRANGLGASHVEGLGKKDASSNLQRSGAAPEEVARLILRLTRSRARALRDSTPKAAMLPAALPKSHKEVAEAILGVFLDPEVAGDAHHLSTGQVLELVAPRVSPNRRDLLKQLLHELCVLSKPTQQGAPSQWTLREEFWKLN